MTELTENAGNWLDARGIDVELAVKLGVRSCDRLGPDTIAFPYVRAGRVVNWKYRATRSKRFCMDEGGQLCLWNGDILADQTLASAPLIITEGELDALVAIQAGFQRVVSVPNGATPGDTGRAYPWLEMYFGLLKNISPIVIAADGDDAGANLLHNLALQLGRPKCKWVSYAAGKDLNDLWREGGAALVVRALEESRWVHVDGVYSLSELPPLPAIKAYDTGFPGLDQHYRMRPHDFVVVTGCPQMGKTTWLNDLACRAVQNHRWHIAIASFEQSPNLDLKRNLRTWYGRKPADDQTTSEIDAADTWINENFSFIVPGDDDEISMAWMVERVDTAILRRGAMMIIVDPWNEMDLTPPPEISQTNYIGLAIREFKRIARKYLVHVIVAAHPAKMRRDKDGIIPVPTLYDIADSAHFANKADVGIVVHRDDTGSTLLKIAKSRYHDQIGRPGMLTMNFNPREARFYQLDSRYEQR